jgi:hypothetical protein
MLLWAKNALIQTVNVRIVSVVTNVTAQRKNLKKEWAVKQILAALKTRLAMEVVKKQEDAI